MAVVSVTGQNITMENWLPELRHVIQTDSGRKVSKVFDQILGQIRKDKKNKAEVRNLVRTMVSLCFVNDKRDFAIPYLIKYKKCFSNKEINEYIKDWKANGI